MNHNDEPVKTEEQDQNGGPATETEMENPSSEIKNKIVPLPPRRTRLWEELLNKIIPWEKITVSLHNFPYYIDEHTKALLVECVASHLKQGKLRKHRGHGHLTSSSDRILLQSIPGTELYRERLVSAIAHELQVPLLKLDDLDYDGEDDDSDKEEDDSDDAYESQPKADPKVCKLKKGDKVKYVGKAIPIEEANNRILSSGQRGEVCEVKGERVAVVFNICGLKAKEAENNEKSADTFQQALVTWLKAKDVKKDHDARTHDFHIAMEVLYGVLEPQQPVIVYFPDSFSWPSMHNYTDKQFPRKEKNIINQFQEGVVMICAQNKSESGPEDTQNGMFMNNFPWKSFPPRTLDMRKLFTNVVHIKPPEDQDLLDTFNKQIEEDKSTVISQNNLTAMNKVLKAHNLTCTSLEQANVEDKILTRKEAEKIVGWATNHYLSSCPIPCLEEGKLHIPHESPSPPPLALFSPSQTRSHLPSRRLPPSLSPSPSPPPPRFLPLAQPVAASALLSSRRRRLAATFLLAASLPLAQPVAASILQVPGIIGCLQALEAIKVAGAVGNHYREGCFYSMHYQLEFVIKLAMLRLKEEEETQSKKKLNIKELATDRHEKMLVSAVVRSEDIGVKFDDVGALENVKKVLHETVILPLRRPELFSHGNLLRPCKGILLFGPPGTGKTLVAKALATESGANFINITTATITSMWLGETENLTRAVFTLASKLAPAIIFVDEVDSLFGVRGCNKYATSRLNEFMAAWDGLTSKESQRILVIGATNRPFDLDEAVIRRMPRRIYVGLPDVENRSTILKILLKKENLESGFSFEQLAEATAGYSGSDLKNLCIAAAYRPIEELLEQETKGEKSEALPAPALRPLNLNDFVRSKAKVRPSVSHNAHSIIQLREWDEQYGEGNSREDRARK